MSFSDLELQIISDILEKYIIKIRPSEDIRDELDYGFEIQNQTIIIYSIRPRFDNKSLKIESPMIKIKYVKTSKSWRIYWQRANLKWISYEPAPEFNKLEECLRILDEDYYGCFWG